MAKPRIMGNIALEDRLAIHSLQFNGTLTLFFSLVVHNEVFLSLRAAPCALRCAGSVFHGKIIAFPLQTWSFERNTLGKALFK